MMVVEIGEVVIVICEVIIVIESGCEGCMFWFFVILVIIGKVENVVWFVFVISVIRKVIIGV